MTPFHFSYSNSGRVKNREAARGNTCVCEVREETEETRERSKKKGTDKKRKLEGD